jgi:tetratricopeptide (TPR) repeat protein
MKKLLLLGLLCLFFLGCPATEKNTALIAIKDHLYERAIAAAKKGMVTFPDDMDYYGIAAKADFYLGKNEEADSFIVIGINKDSSGMFNWLVVKDKDNTEMYGQNFLNLANILLTEKKYNECLRHTNWALLLTPSAANVYIIRGLAYTELGNKEAASAAFKKSLEVDPQNPEPYFRIGMNHFDLKNYDSALVYFNDAIKYFNVSYENAKKTVFANVEFTVPLAQELVSLYRTIATRRDVYNDFMKKKLGYDNPDAQQRSVERFVRLTDGLVRATYFTGITYLNGGKDTMALKLLNTTLDYEPQNIDALYFSGEVLVKFQKWAEAKDHFDRVTKIKEDDIPALFYLGVCYMQLKDYKMALTVYEDRVLKYDPKNLDAFTNIIICYRELGDTKKAMEWLQKKEQVIKGG